MRWRVFSSRYDPFRVGRHGHDVAISDDGLVFSRKRSSRRLSRVVGRASGAGKGGRRRYRASRRVSLSSSSRQEFPACSGVSVCDFSAIVQTRRTSAGNLVGMSARARTWSRVSSRTRRRRGADRSARGFPPRAFHPPPFCPGPDLADRHIAFHVSALQFSRFPAPLVAGRGEVAASQNGSSLPSSLDLSLSVLRAFFSLVLSYRDGRSWNAIGKNYLSTICFVSCTYACTHTHADIA